MMKIWRNKSKERPNTRDSVQDSYKRMFPKSSHSEHRSSVQNYLRKFPLQKD